MTERSVCVIIAAMDAAGTIARAIGSALDQPEVAQVIVVDDGSADDTAGAARTADDGSGRLLVERLPVNRGPSAARNHALGLAQAPFVAVLDADDLLLPGRFARLLAIPDWDIIADNILFVPEDEFTGLDVCALPPAADGVSELDLSALLAGSTHRYATARVQLGFLKPVIRRAVLAGAGLRYDERLRLGEDQLLYLSLLRAGARFRLSGALGYLAVQRRTSLSARHRCEDLAALLQAEQEMLAQMDPATLAARLMTRRVADTRRKWALRAFLQAKRARGLTGALAELGRRPRDWYGVVEGIALDKARTVRSRFAPPQRESGPRLLLPPAEPGAG